MICGIFHSDKKNRVKKESILRLCQSFPWEIDKQGMLHLRSHFGLGIHSSDLATGERESIFQDKERKMVSAFQGNLFNKTELEQTLKKRGVKLQSGSASEIVLKNYQVFGEESFQSLNGGFIVCLWDETEDTFFIVRDHFGIEPIYYSWNGFRCTFGNSAEAIADYETNRKSIDHKALVQYLLFNYIPGEASIYSNVKKLKPGHAIVIKKGAFQIRRYWFLSFGRVHDQGEDSIREALLDLMGDAVRIRAGGDGPKPGVFLSGGMDSSSVVGLLSEMVDQPIHTFSFRCQQKSFDESHYARIVADHYRTEHHLVEFSPEDIASIVEIVEHMDEPFCDIGIEVASYLLGREAKRFVQCILTGDGGDELFGGHPVYLADPAADRFAKIPNFIRGPLFRWLQFLPDTDRKKDLIVKAKRFSYSFGFPGALYSNRWRMYYKDDELRRLLAPDLMEVYTTNDPIEEIAAIYRDADGPDSLSKSLYGDYQTVVGFYLRRMQVLRTFGIEARFPMLDHRLVEYAARIPSELKIKNGKETKYILHRTMEGILPDEIVHRKDKLGHSVPMKNWMRESASVRNFMRDVLFEESNVEESTFNPSAVQRMLDEHLSKRHNRSHRLWALVVLKLWLRKHFG